MRRFAAFKTLLCRHDELNAFSPSVNFLGTTFKLHLRSDPVLPRLPLPLPLPLRASGPRILDYRDVF